MSDNESDITFNAKAYCKVILHAAKYPHCAVNGVLLAKPTKGKALEFVDAIPLFHISLNLLPMAEVALIQIDEYASHKGLVIAGYYIAQENLKDNSIEKAYHRVYEKIAQHFNSACLVVVDNSKMSLAMDNVALKVMVNDGNYKLCDTNRIVLKPSKTLDICSQLLESNMNDSFSCLVDFDNHLDNVALDWLNPSLNKQIEGLL